MSNYRIDNNIFFGGDGVYIETREFQVLKEFGLMERIVELVSEHMRSNKVDLSETTYDIEAWDGDNSGLNCNYKQYSEMIYDIVSYNYSKYESNAEISPQKIPDELLEALVNEGYIKNGLIKQSHFFKNKYGDYKISNDGFQRIIKTNELLFENSDLIEFLFQNNLVSKIDDTTVKVNTALLNICKHKNLNRDSE